MFPSPVARRSSRSPVSRSNSILRDAHRGAQNYASHANFRPPSPAPSAPRQRLSASPPQRRQRSATPTNRYIGQFDASEGPVILEPQPLPRNSYVRPSSVSRRSPSPRGRPPSTARERPRQSRSPAAKPPCTRLPAAQKYAERDDEYRPSAHTRREGERMASRRSPVRKAKKGIPDSMRQRLLAASDVDENAHEVRKTKKKKPQTRPRCPSFSSPSSEEDEPPKKKKNKKSKVEKSRKSRDSDVERPKKKKMQRQETPQRSKKKAKRRQSSESTSEPEDEAPKKLKKRQSSQPDREAPKKKQKPKNTQVDDPGVHVTNSQIREFGPSASIKQEPLDEYPSAFAGAPTSSTFDTPQTPGNAGPRIVGRDTGEPVRENIATKFNRLQQIIHGHMHQIQVELEDFARQLQNER